jgi:hypothetical protein
MGGGEEPAGIEAVKQILQGSAFVAWLYASLILLSALFINLLSEFLSGTPLKFLSNLAENWLALVAIYASALFAFFAVFVFCGWWTKKNENDPAISKRWRDYERDRLSKRWRSKRKRQ